MLSSKCLRGITTASAFSADFGPMLMSQRRSWHQDIGLFGNGPVRYGLLNSAIILFGRLLGSGVLSKDFGIEDVGVTLSGTVFGIDLDIVFVKYVFEISVGFGYLSDFV